METVNSIMKALHPLQESRVNIYGIPLVVTNLSLGDVENMIFSNVNVS